MRYLALSVIIAGILLRVVQAFEDRCLWLDEAMLAVNIESRSFGELFHPLKYSQAAPIGFLVAQKIVGSSVNDHEIAARLLPFIASTAALILTYRLYSPVACVSSLTGLLISAFSPSLLCYAGEGKQYALDILSTSVALCAANHWLSGGPTRGNRAALIYCVVAPWMAHTAMFFLPVFFWLGCTRIREIGWWRLTTGLALVAGSIAALFVINISGNVQNQHLRQFWAADFLPWQQSWSTLWHWGLRKAIELFARVPGLAPVSSTSGLGQAAALLIAASSGLLFLLTLRQRERSSADWLVVLLFPLGACLSASILRLYPFGNRLLLFSVPIVVFGIVHGLKSINAALPRQWWILAAFSSLLVCYPCVGVAERMQGRSGSTNEFAVHAPEDIRPLIDHMSQIGTDGDICYVFQASAPAFELYRDRIRTSPIEFRIGTPGTAEHYRNEVQEIVSGGAGTYFVLFSHTTAWGFNETVLAVEWLIDRGAARIVPTQPDDACLYICTPDTCQSEIQE